MKLNSNTGPACSRREMLKVGALAALPFMSPSAVRGLLNQEPIAANGSPDPYPIPWLDKNGSHNQPAGPNLEPSHIYHFKGKVARCSTFTGMGTDNQGNRIPFGDKTTDYGVMAGDYWAARRWKPRRPGSLSRPALSPTPAPSCPRPFRICVTHEH